MKRYPIGSRQHEIRVMLAQKNMTLMQLAQNMGVTKQMVDKLFVACTDVRFERLKKAIEKHSSH